MSFASGFVQGFAGTLAEGMLERQKEGRDYFNKQVEYARTTGLENRRKVKQTVDSNLAIARQLEAVGVPKEVIMAQVNQDPQSLGNLFDTVESIRADSQRDLSPDEWRAIMKVGGRFQAPDEDLSTFISRTYDPISNAVSDPTFADDPESSLMASILGFDSMSKARRRLAKTEIAEGLTAEQLMRYGDVQPQRIGGEAVVTTDYSAIPQRPKEKEDGELSTSQALAIRKAVEDGLEAQIARSNFVAGSTTPEEAMVMGQELAARLAADLPDVPIERIQTMVNNSLAARGFLTAPETAVEAAPTASPTEGSPEQERPSEAPPSAPTGKTPDMITTKDGVKLILVRDNDDGTSTFRDESGNEYPLRTDLVRQ